MVEWAAKGCCTLYYTRAQVSSSCVRPPPFWHFSPNRPVIVDVRRDAGKEGLLDPQSLIIISSPERAMPTPPLRLLFTRFSFTVPFKPSTFLDSHLEIYKKENLISCERIANCKTLEKNIQIKLSESEYSMKRRFYFSSVSFIRTHVKIIDFADMKYFISISFRWFFFKFCMRNEYKNWFYIKKKKYSYESAQANRLYYQNGKLFLSLTTFISRLCRILFISLLLSTYT